MDTDYLTPMAYDCIVLAYDAVDVLRSELGAACSQFEDEDTYLQGVLAYVKEIEEDPEDYLGGWKHGRDCGRISVRPGQRNWSRSTRLTFQRSGWGIPN